MMRLVVAPSPSAPNHYADDWFERRVGWPMVGKRVIIVDDHRAFAELLSISLTSVGFEVVAISSSAAEAVDRTHELAPDLVVMDIEMPRQDGLLATRQIREQRPETVVAVVTAHEDPAWIARAAQAGASAFIPKNGSLAEMISVLERAAVGQLVVAPSAFADQARSRTEEPVPELTTREVDVLTQLAKGSAAKQMAEELGLSVHTCRGYLKSVRHKLGVGSQVEALIKAQQLGLVDRPDDHGEPH